MNIDKKSTDRRGFIKGAAAVGAGAALAPYLSKAGLVSASTAPSVPPGHRGRGQRGRRGRPTPSTRSAWPTTPPSTR